MYFFFLRKVLFCLIGYFKKLCKLLGLRRLGRSKVRLVANDRPLWTTEGSGCDVVLS